MKIKLKDIGEDGLLLEGAASTADFDFPLQDYQQWKEIQYRLYASILGSECLVQGRLSTSLQAPCARCLEPRPLTVEVPEFRISYDISGLESIDLTEQIREDILLGLPLAPRCELDADFRCPQTGKVHRPDSDEFAERKREMVWGELEKLKIKESHGSSQT